MNRTTPEHITSLAADEVFVFGSNARGTHGGGAARVAFDRFGAVWGEGEGHFGQSYALPTMGGMDEIRDSARKFRAFAAEHADLTFLLTKVACGIAGYDEAEIAPLFADTPANVIKPAGW